MDISCNPEIHYKNNENCICAFAALSSVLYYFQRSEDASNIMDFCKEYEKNKHNIFSRVVQSIFNYINHERKFRELRKQYVILRVNTGFDAINYKLQDLEFGLLVLHQSNNNESHAVSISQNYIFDSNASNAVPRTQEGFDCCCSGDATFESIVFGYIFHLRRK